MWKLNNILLSNYGSKKKVKREKLSWSKWKWKAAYQIPCCCLVVQLCLTPCDPLDCSPPGSSVHGILQARILKWVAMPSSRASSPPSDQTSSPASSALQADSSPLSHPGSPHYPPAIPQISILLDPGRVLGCLINMQFFGGINDWFLSWKNLEVRR